MCCGGARGRRPVFKVKVHGQVDEWFDGEDTETAACLYAAETGGRVRRMGTSTHRPKEGRHEQEA